MARTLLNDEDLEKVVGGVALNVNLIKGVLTVDMLTGADSVDDLFNRYSGTIQLIGGAKGMDICNEVKGSLNKYSEKIAKCEININTFVPTYYDKGGIAYSQTQVNQW